MLESFKNNRNISKTFHITGTYYNSSNATFVASFEGNKYPIYGVQYHPEKNPFEFKVKASHTAEAVDIAYQMARFFVNEARKSTHSFNSTSELREYSIFNYPKVTSDKVKYMEVYFFKKIFTLGEGYEDGEYEVAEI